MDTLQLLNMVKTFCGDSFAGVFPADHLPVPKKGTSCLFIANTEYCQQSGEHWICIYIGQNQIGEFFDSFGRPPDQIFKKYMNKHCKYWSYNNEQLQSAISSYCGHYCVFYCLYRCKNFSMHTIVSWFTSDTGLNDVLVEQFVRGRLQSI